MTQPELLNEMAEFVLDRVDPLRKAEKKKSKSQAPKADKQKAREAAGVFELKGTGEELDLQRGVSSAPTMKSDSESGMVTPWVKNSNRRISAPIARSLMQATCGKCSYVSPITGECCDSEYQLERDHIVPVAKGGSSDSENLRPLCRTHNQLMAIKHFGRRKMSRYLKLE